MLEVIEAGLPAVARLDGVIREDIEQGVAWIGSDHVVSDERPAVLEGG